MTYKEFLERGETDAIYKYEVSAEDFKTFPTSELVACIALMTVIASTQSDVPETLAKNLRGAAFELNERIPARA